ncbi:hypothetical protein V8E51_000039 [Hyaloscypha variabilis]
MEESYPTEFSDPIVVGPNGSGSKGSGVSQDAYAQSADTYGYQGSYNSQNGSKQSEAELAGNSSSSNWSGGGGSGGRGGGGGGGGRGGWLSGAGNRTSRNLTQPNQHTNAQPNYEWVWSCCYCPEYTGMSTDTVLACPGCNHLRCFNCRLDPVLR